MRCCEVRGEAGIIVQDFGFVGTFYTRNLPLILWLLPLGPLGCLYIVFLMACDERGIRERLLFHRQGGRDWQGSLAWDECWKGIRMGRKVAGDILKSDKSISTIIGDGAYGSS